MSHPFRGSAKTTSRSKFKSISGKKGQGTGTQGQSQMASTTKRSGVEGGKVQGGPAANRLDHRARGGRTGSKVNINIVSLPGGKDRASPPPLLPGPLGAAAPPMQPGSLPSPVQGGGGPPFKQGGRVRMTGGAQGGTGRLQKAQNARRDRLNG